VVKYTHRKRAWACGFCGGFLSGRDRYFDHVARHYEDGCNRTHWNHSLVIYGLLHQPSLTNAWKDLNSELYGHLPRGQQPMFEWEAEATGHAQGFLDGESPGKLQDLLEFHDESRGDSGFLARLAHDQAVIRFRSDAADNIPKSTRPVSEPPRPLDKTRTSPFSAVPKHMSAQPHTANHPSHDQIHQYNIYSQSQHQRQQPSRPQPRAQSEIHPEQHRFMTPYTFPSTIIEGTETDFFGLPAAVSPLLSGRSTIVTMGNSNSNSNSNSSSSSGSSSTPQSHYTPHPSSHGSGGHHPQLSVSSMSDSGMLQDWQSLTTTVVDDAAFEVHSASVGWQGGMLGRSSHAAGHGAG